MLDEIAELKHDIDKKLEKVRLSTVIVLFETVPALIKISFIILKYFTQ